MSTLRATTIANLAGTGSPDITGGELSRARFNFNGTGVIAIRNSFNISSLTDNGTGSYTTNFSVAFPNANYAFSPAVRLSGSPVTATPFIDASTAGSAQMLAQTISGTPVNIDVTYVLAAVCGDKP